MATITSPILLRATHLTVNVPLLQELGVVVFLAISFMYGMVNYAIDSVT